MSVSCATCTIPSERMGKRALRLAFISLALAVIVVGTTALVVWRHEGYVEIDPTCCADHQHYLAMAGGLPEHPEAAKTPPYAYRLLSPQIVRLLPFSATTGFHLLTTAALIGAAALLFLLLRTMGFDDLAAAAGLVIFGSLYWLVESTQVDFLLVDPLTFFLFVAFLLALYRNPPSTACRGNSLAGSPQQRGRAHSSAGCARLSIPHPSADQAKRHSHGRCSRRGLRPPPPTSADRRLIPAP